MYASSMWLRGQLRMLRGDFQITRFKILDLSRQVAAVFGAAFTSELGLADFGGSALNPDRSG